MELLIDDSPVALAEASNFAFARRPFARVTVTTACRTRVTGAEAVLHDHLERKLAIYGVTTGFGDSNRNAINASQSEELQRNLVAYLLCGTGALLPRPAVRAMCLARLVSLSRGYSGVSWDLIEMMQNLLTHDLLPNVPCEGSLGASGDLVPLAYLADVVQGQGTVSTPDGDLPTAEALRKCGLHPYKLKPKEGLALVNGTSTMVGMAMYNHAQLAFALELAELATSWTCLALGGSSDAFGPLVNERAKLHIGQKTSAQRISALLAAEDYQSRARLALHPERNVLEQPLQDRYSLRCAPQILGPVVDTLSAFSEWLELELNSVSDNPLFDSGDGTMAMGGNFYGGYLGHGMDYFKICTASIADMLDRQLLLLFDPKTSAGLPPNLAHWGPMRADERHLHHGLKGLHQVTNALTSEICSMSGPSTVFSRSSECHNQDKVSLGLSAAVSCSHMLDKLYSVCALHLSCLAQALTIRERQLKGPVATAMHALIRRHVPFVERDMALGAQVNALSAGLKAMALRTGSLW